MPEGRLWAKKDKFLEFVTGKRSQGGGVGVSDSAKRSFRGGERVSITTQENAVSAVEGKA